MYVCNCNGFTEKQVDVLLETTGARTPAQVYRGLHCKPQCGKCAVDIRKMINEHRHGAPVGPLPAKDSCRPPEPPPAPRP